MLPFSDYTKWFDEPIVSVGDAKYFLRIAYGRKDQKFFARSVLMKNVNVVVPVANADDAVSPTGPIKKEERGARTGTPGEEAGGLMQSSAFNDAVKAVMGQRMQSGQEVRVNWQPQAGDYTLEVEIRVRSADMLEDGTLVIKDFDILASSLKVRKRGQEG